MTVALKVMMELNVHLKKKKDLWFRRNFPLMGAVSLWLGNRFSLAHSTSILSAQITAQPVSQWPVSAPRIPPLQCYTFRVSQRLPDPA